MNYKKFGKLDFKQLHPEGSLGTKLKTVEDLMLTGTKIPFVKENLKMDRALKVISEKKLGVLVIKNNKGLTSGIIVDGDIKRAIQKNKNFQKLSIKDIMTKKPISVSNDTLAVKALSIMNSKKITSLCVHNNKNKQKTIGILHIHRILEANIQ